MNQRGQSLIGALVGIGIAAMTVVVIMTIQQISTRQQAQSNFTFQADQLRRNLQLTMNNLGAWANTIAASENSPPYTLGGPDYVAPPGANAGLNCLVGTGSNCLDGGGAAILNAPINVVRDQSGTVIYNSLTNNGFTLQGVPCNTFVAPPAAGNDSCPLRINITWSAICGVTCTGSNVVPQISVIPVYNPNLTNPTRLQFNPANYSAVFKQGADGVTCWTYANGALYDSCSGNVGIGTTSPGSILDLVSSSPPNVIADAIRLTTYNNIPSSADVLLRRARGTQAAPLPVLANDQLGTIGTWAFDGVTWKESSAIYMQAETDFATSSKGYIAIKTNDGTGSSERVRITSTGNVGIGTTSPAYPLDIGNGTGQQILLVNGGASGISGGSAIFLIQGGMQGSTGSAVGTWSAIVPAGPFVADSTLWSANVWRFVTNGSANERMRIDAAGNVGIGTTSPVQLLDVNGNISSRNDIIATQNFYARAGGRFSWGDDSGAAMTNPAPNSIGFTIAGAEKLRIAGGNVGIGTANPTVTLQVNGQIQTTSQNNYFGVLVTDLTAYHPGCVSPGITGSYFWAQCIAGCNRLCKSKGYSGGTMVENDSVNAGCLCSP